MSALEIAAERNITGRKKVMLYQPRVRAGAFISAIFRRVSTLLFT